MEPHGQARGLLRRRMKFDYVPMRYEIGGTKLVETFQELFI